MSSEEKCFWCIPTPKREEITTFLCRKCHIKELEYQKRVAEVFLKTAQSPEWKNLALERDAKFTIENRNREIKKLKEDKK